MPPPEPPDQRTYSEKLKDARWAKFRDEVFRIANWTCEECHDYLPKKGLEAHHIFYLTGKAPWEHPKEIMMALCSDCHMKRQGIEQRFFFDVAKAIRLKSSEELENAPVTWFFRSQSTDLPKEEEE